MKDMNGRSSSPNEMIGMLLSIEEAKAAIKDFEDGEINVREALRRLILATRDKYAAA